MTDIFNSIADGASSRLAALGITVKPEDAELLSFVIKSAVSELCSITGYNALPSELIDAAADIVCADFALTVMARDGTDGAEVSSRRDGSMSVSYTKGTSRAERLRAELKKMRERGLSVAGTKRRLVW